MDQNQPRTLNRREFVRTLTFATAGAGFLATAFRGVRLTPDQKEEVSEALADKLGRLPKRPFGKRLGGMKVTPIVMASDWSRDLIGPGLDAGINFIHKAGYWNELPEELKKVPRDSYYTDITVDNTPNNPDDEDAAYRQVTESLRKNGLKYYDIFKAHFGWKTVDDLKTKQGSYRAFERLKKEGKVKYFGVSQHPYIPYPEIIDALIADGRITNMQVFYSYGSSKEDQAIFQKASRAGIGMMAMKVMANGNRTMRGKPEVMKSLGAPGQVGRACYRHVLTAKGSDGKPFFDCCVTNLRNFEHFEENMGAASTKISAVEGFELLA